MGKRTEDITIDGISYRVTQLGTVKGVPLGHRLIKAIGPAIIEFIEKMPKGTIAKAVSSAKAGPDLDLDIDVGALGQAFVKALNDMPSELLEAAAKEFAANTKFHDDGQPDGMYLDLKEFYDDHFAGEYSRWTKWFIACARFNFAGFFPSTAS